MYAKFQDLFIYNDLCRLSRPSLTYNGAPAKVWPSPAHHTQDHPTLTLIRAAGGVFDFRNFEEV